MPEHLPRILYVWNCITGTSTSIDTICYDEGCHLKKYAQNKRAELTETAKRIATCSIVVDKMHFRGHTDAWCHKNCNPYELEQLRNVNTSYNDVIATLHVGVTLQIVG